MKYFLTAIVILFTLHVEAQKFNVQKVEIRVYDLQGKRIGTGKIKAVTGTSMHFKPYSGKMREIPFREIGMIKTNHTKGNGILIGAATGAGLGAIFGAGSSSGINAYASAFSEDEISKGESAIFGALLGGLLGGGIGWIVDVTNKHTYHIRGKKFEWEDFKLDLKGFEAGEISDLDIDNPDENIQTDESSTDVFNPKDRFPHRKWELTETGTFGDSMK